MQSDGKPLRAHLMNVWRQSGIKPPELDVPLLPIEAAHLWAWFNELSMRRTWSDRGPNPITWSDVLAWQQLTGKKPAPWEVQAMLSLDAIFFKHAGRTVE